MVDPDIHNSTPTFSTGLIALILHTFDAESKRVRAIAAPYLVGRVAHPERSMRFGY